MSKYLLTGDWHVKKGIQTDIILQFLDYIKSYYFDNDISYIIVNGDVFHKSANIKNEAFISLFLKLMKMKEIGEKMIFIPGNHDIMNVDNDSIIETFASFGQMYKQGTKGELNNDKFYLQPYTKREQDLPTPEEDTILITHVPIADFAFDNNFHATEKHAFKPELFEGWFKVFTGHFHKHQSRKNVVYIGSPNQMYRSEIGQVKGFVVLDTDIEDWEFVPYTAAPTFVEITEDDILKITDRRFDNNLVVVRLTQKVREYGKLRYLLYEKGAVDVIPIFETQTEDNIKIEIGSSGDTLPDIARKTISSIEKVDGISKEYLLKIFDKVLSEC